MFGRTSSRPQKALVSEERSAHSKSDIRPLPTIVSAAKELCPAHMVERALAAMTRR